VDGDDDSCGEERARVGDSWRLIGKNRRGGGMDRKGKGRGKRNETSTECVFVIRACGAAEAGTSFMGSIRCGDDAYNGPEVARGASGSSSGVG
jgi:hypothetical protein